MKKAPTVGEILIGIGRECYKSRGRVARELRFTIENLRLKDLKILNLTITQVQIIVLAWLAHIEGQRNQFSSLDLLKHLYPNKPAKILQSLDQIIDLEKKEVFDCDNRRIADYHSDVKPQIQFAKEMLLENTISFTQRFLRLLVENKTDMMVEEDQSYHDNDEFLNDWFNYISAVSEYASWKSRRYDRGIQDAVIEDFCTMARLQERLEKRTAISRSDFPFMQMTAEYALDSKEQMIVIKLLMESLNNSSGNISDLVGLISTGSSGLYRNQEYFSPSGKLVKNGLISLSDGNFLSRNGEATLCPETARRILDDHSFVGRDKLQELLRDNNFITIVEPTVSINNLVLPQTLKQTLLTSLEQFQSHVTDTLLEWQILPQDLPNRHSGLTLLFHGLPGTGKTFAAHAVAHYLGRKVITTDISRILSCWVGESQKNVRAIFDVYQRIVQQVENPPVLLLNEADQFLMKRGEASRSADRMYNQMQNLFLEAFENFKGILICTTNLRSLLDPAFSRRFHLKLEFPLPGMDERIELWKIHLTQTIPGASLIDIGKFARQFELTGGQIAVIVKNAAIEVAARSVSDRILYPTDLEKYCRLEADTMFEKNRIRMGFIRDDK